MLKLSLFLIFVTFGSHFATADEFNVKLLQLINHEIRINEELMDDSRKCILEKLGVVEVESENIHYSFDLSSLAIGSAWQICENTSIVANEKLKHLNHYHDPMFVKNIDCLKLKYKNYDENSILLKNFDASTSEESCKDTIKIYEQKYSLSYFQSYRNSVIDKYHIEICSTEELFSMLNIEKTTISMTIIANSDISDEDLSIVTEEVNITAKAMQKSLLNCLIKEMKAGNFGKITPRN